MKYKCTIDPSHVFEVATDDFWCPICVDKNGMLELLEDNNAEENTTPNNSNSTTESGNSKALNCGKCKAPFQVNLDILALNKIIVVCNQCQTKNIVGLEKNYAIPAKKETENTDNNAKRSRVKIMLSIENNGNKVQKGLNLGSNIIGRNDFKVDRFLSTKHCNIKLSVKAGALKIHIIDLKSTNGTFDFNKNRLVPNQAYVVKMNVYYYIGSSKMKITI